MTDIERLEKEISEKKAELRRLKDAENPKLHFGVIFDPLQEEYGCYSVMEMVIATLRDFIAVVSSAHKTEFSEGHTRLSASTRKVRMKEMGSEKIVVCREFLNELAPIIIKYIKCFVEMNEVRNA